MQKFDEIKDVEDVAFYPEGTTSEDCQMSLSYHHHVESHILSYFYNPENEKRYDFRVRTC